MEGYDGWYDDEDPMAPGAETAVPRPALAPGDRRSRVLYADDQPVLPQSSAGAGASADEAAGAQARPRPLPTVPTDPANRQSRVFPGKPLAPPRASRNLDGLREPVYQAENRWSYLVLAMVVLAGSIVMFSIGCACARAYYEDSTQGGAVASQSICGPAGGGGGIVMIIAGCFGMIVAGYEVWVLREPFLKLTGYKPVGQAV